MVALASVLLYPGLEDAEIGYVYAMRDLLPAGLLGMMVASFAAAFMSTISTQLNWGSSYLVNDIYRRFLRRDGSETHYVLASRLATVLLAGLGALTAATMGSVEGAWKFLLAIGAGTGPVYLLRWYWWRINAWSEVSAMAAALIVSLILQWIFGLDVNAPSDFALVMLLTVVLTSVVWLTVTYMTGPEDESVLDPVSFSYWILGCVVVFTSLFGIGHFLVGSTATGIIMLVCSVGVGWFLWSRLSNPESLSPSHHS
jgi:Na+/proline symporter